MGKDYKELPKSMILLYYKRPEIQEAIASYAESKEVVGSFGGKGYAKRPDILQFPSDVLEQVKRGITSFHMSEETWSNPLILEAGMKKKDQDTIRIGWDLILDIDSKMFELSKLATDLLIQALKYNGIKTVTVKFSGNHGFHIAVPFEAFPQKVHGTPTRELFPEGPKKIAEYLNDMIKNHLAQEILQEIGSTRLEKEIGISYEEMSPNGEFDPFTVVDIDTILISSRHLFRMPYSFNEKSGLVSIPLLPEQVRSFKREDAVPEKVEPGTPFLERSSCIPREAEKLFISAFDFVAPSTTIFVEEEKKKEISFEELQEKIPEDLFPPCIKKILAGIHDGKKRSLFILTNFLISAGWTHEDIEERLMKWAEACPEPIREVLIKGHLRHHKATKKQILPPNCDNKAYYKDMNFCDPDQFCARVKNPVSYARKKSFLIEKAQPKRNAKDKDVQS